MGNVFDDMLKRNHNGMLRKEELMKEVYWSDSHWEVLCQKKYGGVDFVIASFGKNPIILIITPEQLYKDFLGITPLYGKVYFYRMLKVDERQPSWTRFKVPPMPMAPATPNCLMWKLNLNSDWDGHQSDEFNMKLFRHRWSLQEVYDYAKKLVEVYLSKKDTITNIPAEDDEDETVAVPVRTNMKEHGECI